MTPIIGIDFGTTNSVVAVLHPDGSVATARFPVGADMLDVFRSVLCFWTEEARAPAAACTTPPAPPPSRPISTIRSTAG
jgi:hypothetical chaperone protein